MHAFFLLQFNQEVGVMNLMYQLMFNQMQNTPAMKQVNEYIKANGGDAQAAFYKLAKEKGVDPQEILNQIR